jgi:hypothetical protein
MLFIAGGEPRNTSSSIAPAGPPLIASLTGNAPSTVAKPRLWSPANRRQPGHEFSRKKWLADKNNVIIFLCAGQPRVYSRFRATMEAFCQLIIEPWTVNNIVGRD